MSLTDMPWAEMALSALGGGGGAKLIDFFARRGRTKAYTMGAVDHAVQTAMTLVTERLEKVEAQHGECEKNLREVRDELAEAKAEINRLMLGPIANYGDRAPRDA